MSENKATLHKVSDRAAVVYLSQTAMRKLGCYQLIDISSPDDPYALLLTAMDDLVKAPDMSEEEKKAFEEKLNKCLHQQGKAEVLQEGMTYKLAKRFEREEE